MLLLRRQKILKLLGKKVLVVASASFYKEESNSYALQEDGDFFYLTGLNKVKAILVMSNLTEAKITLFVHQPNDFEKVWVGGEFRDEQKKAAHLQDVKSLDLWEEEFTKILRKSEGIVTNLNCAKLLHQVNKVNGQLGGRFAVHSTLHYVGKVRAIKDQTEIDHLRMAISITNQALMAVKNNLHAHLNEQDVQSILDSVYAQNKVTRSFPPIVAAANNALILHYINNDQPLQDKREVLIDTGVQYQGMCSDISRTFFLKINPYQKIIYNIVLNAQKEGIKHARPGSNTFAINQIVAKSLVEQMLQHKVIKGDLKSILQNKDYLSFYPHGSSHHLGLDTHDAVPYFDEKGNILPLQKGMVITMEPGLYLSSKNKMISRNFRNIAVRIEDDILIGKNPVNLSSIISQDI